MRRSGRTSNGAVPAFFTRSKAKNFFGTSSNETPNNEGNKQQQDEGVVKQSDQKEEVVQIGNQNSPIPKLKTEVDQAQPSTNDIQTTQEMLAESQNSEKDSRPGQVDEDMKLGEEEVKVQLTKTDNLGSQVGRPKDVSATTKALQQMKQMMDAKRISKKKPKIPLCIRRRKLNQRLNKILMPKSGLIFLHELKPGCTFKIQEQPGSNPPVFVAQVEYNDKLLALGQGVTKPSAKNAAAENAIRVLVAEALTQQANKRQNTDSDEAQSCPPTDSSAVDELMDTSDDLSLAGLASFAMYKMFTEWHSQGTGFPLLNFQPKRKPTVSKAPSVKKELPPNADKLHPSFLLNTMRPGVLSTELERSSKDNVSCVTMGYEIDGKIYKGSGSNKKEARKRAAQAALSDLYGLHYED